jgi:uncharacterized protein (TIGR02145 family)
MKWKDIRRFFLGLNRDDSPAYLKDGEYVDAFNIRAVSSEDEQEAGNAETMQGEVEVLIDVSADITYYGEAIGGDFFYLGYEEVQIGSQVWMKENWKVAYPGSKVYDDDEDNRSVFGGLYTWHQAMSADFCPDGYRVPTEADIDALLTYLGGAMLAGGKMKEPGVVNWDDPNTDADDSSGFKARGGGKYDSAFDLIREMGYFWIADEAEPLPPVPTAPLYVTATSFMALWAASAGVTGYHLDVAEDADFLVMVAGYDALDVGNVLTAEVVGLAPETPYYYRLRAYNEIGTGYNSATQGVTTTTAITDMDGNIYTTVIIGKAEWMVENLRTTTYRDGTAIPNITEANEGAELITGWTNKPGPENYDFFVSATKNITRATKAAQALVMPAPWCYTNVMTLSAGDLIRIIVNITNNVTDFPEAILVYYVGAVFHTETWTLTAGQNIFHHIMAGNTTTCVLRIVGPAGNPALDFTAECSVKEAGWAEDLAGAYCWYDNNIANLNPYGALYNWYAVNNAHGLLYFEYGGLESEGWRVPLKSDFETLISIMGGQVIAGGKLKEIGVAHWNAPNTGATDEYGFSAVGAGWRSHSGFEEFNTRAFLWTQTVDSGYDVDAWAMLLYNTAAAVVIWNPGVFWGCSIRCVRDI